MDLMMLTLAVVNVCTCKFQKRIISNIPGVSRKSRSSAVKQHFTVLIENEFLTEIYPNNVN